MTSTAWSVSTSPSSYVASGTTSAAGGIYYYDPEVRTIKKIEPKYDDEILDKLFLWEE